MGIAAQAITWQHDFDRALKEAASKGNHLLVDFTAAPM
jgi:hypothetical protein